MISSCSISPSWPTPDRPDDAVIWTVKAHNGSVQGLAVSTDGLIATASSAGNVRVWSPEGQLLADLPIRPDDVPSVAFASGTNTLYYEDGNDVIRKFSLDTAASIRLARSLVTRAVHGRRVHPLLPPRALPELRVRRVLDRYEPLTAPGEAFTPTATDPSEGSTLSTSRSAPQSVHDATIDADANEMLALHSGQTRSSTRVTYPLGDRTETTDVD